MDYFKRLLELLQTEREEDRQSYLRLRESTSVHDRRTNGLTWYPIAIRGTEPSRGDYITVEAERTTHKDISHQLRFGVSATLFSNHNADEYHADGIISWQSGDRLKITLRTDELPEWAENGKLGIDLLFDENSYEEMLYALNLAAKLADNKEEGKLIRVLTGTQQPARETDPGFQPPDRLNEQQQEAVRLIVEAQDLAIVHGPPGTGKTTTLVQAIRRLRDKDGETILVVAPSNAAVDLLSEKLAEEGLNVLRVGNPVRVSEKLASLTLDSRMSLHPSMKEIKKMKKQAAAYKDMAHKYKRHFGHAEREQRKALFQEAHRIMKDVDRTEQYIIDDITAKSHVIAATLVGAAHYTVRGIRYKTVVIDEAGQALEPACWIPILKGKKLVLAGDHCQLPPTVKSPGEAGKALSETLLEKLVKLHPASVVLLEEQYRMNTSIMSYPSQIFYKGKLRAAPNVAERTLFTGDMPVSFIDTAGTGYDEKQEGTAISNPEEAALVIRHFRGLVERYTSGVLESFPTVGIISPYKQQVRLLDELMDHAGLGAFKTNISINTIDSFQGQERDIIYISMVRSNAEGVIGFLADKRRMNVAMTRAKKKLVVIGDSATLSRDTFYAGFIEYAENSGGYQSAWEFMDI